jgi:hypothetical protein
MSSSILINVQCVFFYYIVLKYKKLHNTLSGKIIFTPFIMSSYYL